MKIFYLPIKLALLTLLIKAPIQADNRYRDLAILGAASFIGCATFILSKRTTSYMLDQAVIRSKVTPNPESNLWLVGAIVPGIVCASSFMALFLGSLAMTQGKRYAASYLTGIASATALLKIKGSDRGYPWS